MLWILPILLFLTPGFAAERPNVVIFFTEDQGTLEAGCYGSGHLHTPNIDRLAATGTRFTQAYAHTVCCPSRAILMTGRHPQRSGVSLWTPGNMKGPKGRNMALVEVPLAEALQAEGYRTALFGKWHLGAHEDYGPKKQRFDEYSGIRNGFIDKVEELNLREKTILIFMSDNGHFEETTYRIQGENHGNGYPGGHFYGASGGGNTGKWIGHKGTFLEGGIRVPAILGFEGTIQ